MKICLLAIAIMYSISADGQKNKIPASARIQPTYDSMHDESASFMSSFVLTGKKLFLGYADSLERMLDVEVESLPYLKFQLPVDTTEDEAEDSTIAMYRANTKTIHLLPNAVDYILNTICGDMDSLAIERGKVFEGTAVHELAHWIHDLFFRKITGNTRILCYEDIRWGSKDEFTAQVEFEAVGEGLAEWVEAKYLKKTLEYADPESFPSIYQKFMWEENGRYYSLSFIGPILDVDFKLGLEYLSKHLFRIDTSFRISATQYQKEAIDFLKKEIKKKKRKK